jgi:hypothetical protein
MQIHPLHLISYLVAVASLIAWLTYLIHELFVWVRKAGFSRRLGGKILSPNLPEQDLPWKGILLAVSGACFGWFLTSWVGAWIEKDWLLLCLSGLGVLSFELWSTKRESHLLPIMALITGLHEQAKDELDLFERLARVVEGLPAGEVQKAVREALQRRRSGLTVEQCFKVLKGLNPFLDELVYTLRWSGWQACPAFDLALERLGERAGKQWDRTSQALLFKEKMQPLRQFGQPFLYAALTFLVVDGLPSFMLAWPSIVVVGWIGFGCAVTAGLFYAGLTRPWLNRFLGAVILAASLVALVQFASPPRLVEFQINEVTHLSQDASPVEDQWEPFHTYYLGLAGLGNQERHEPWPKP